MKDLTAQSPPRTDAEYQVEIDRLIAQIEAMQREARDSDARFERKHADIMASISQTSAILDRLAAR